MKHTGLLFLGLTTVVLLAGPTPEVISAELKPKTAAAFDEYMRNAEARLEKQARNGTFLWVDGSPERRRQVRAGKAIAEPWTGKGEIEIPDGLVHDWVGAVFIPGVTLESTLRMVQNYDDHKRIYKPEVVDSRLLGRNGDDFKIYLRLLKKKILTVVLNTHHDVHYYPVEGKRARSRSYTTRVAEVQNPGEPDERELAPGTGHGFLWRLNSFWRFEERDGGVYMECEAISLTRSVPTGTGWVITPIIRSLPRESLVNTLEVTKRAATR